MSSPRSSSTTTLILLRISLALVATLAICLLLIATLHGFPYGDLLLYGVAFAGCLYLGREFLNLLKSLEAVQRPGRLGRVQPSE